MKKQKQITNCQSLIFDNIQHMEDTLEKKSDPAPWRNVVVELFDYEKLGEERLIKIIKKLNCFFEEYMLDLVPLDNVTEECANFRARFGL